ncbi:hypothetical protein SADUNF_Sadunf11G0094600 [Salix dunnii]|uniref:Uncharacterized protein n=1 Tax=Salix dunnii TaxID=1413687 RepID=A0A835MTI9_9ROSI|nr:hypothetical protein SADUNF_Sadunf11G0094600 [Salix dunnii]
MGGGGVMRAAAKVAGIGVAKAGISRGISGVPPPVEQSMRNASSQVSAIKSSKASRGDEVVTGMQMPAWEVDEWELAGGVEEEMVRVVFWGAPPSLQEAKAATCELKDALRKVYPNLGTGSSLEGSQLSGLFLTTNSDSLETKGCISCDPIQVPEPNHAMQAFQLLDENPKIQDTVASIASDPKVWNAVWENKDLQDLLHSQNTTKESVEDKESVGDTDSQDAVSSEKLKELSDDESETGNSQTGLMNFINNVKLTVVEMVKNVSAYFQKIYGSPSAEHDPAAGDENAGLPTTEKTLVASLMGLAVMVIIVVVLKRPRL